MRRHPAVVGAHYAALIVLAAVCVTPIVVMFATSLKFQTQIFDTGLRFFFMPTLENYRGILSDGSFLRYLTNSLIVGIVSTAITLVLGCMAAYGLARFRFPGRKTVAYTTLLLRTVPLAVLAVPVFMLWSRAGLINSLSGLILLYVAVNLPFTVWLLYGFVLQVPSQLEEAAAIDGCGPIRVFYRIDRATRTLPVAASLFITDIGVDWGKIMALGSLIAIPPLVFTFIAARQIITGLTAGAVKG
jgi:multiple sugar transport system permease protein